MNKTLRLGLTLGLYAAVSCLTLAVVNNFTAPVIEKLEAEKENAALKMVLADASEYISVDKAEIDALLSSGVVNAGTVTVNKIFKAVNADKETVGYAANLTGPTFEKSSILLGMNSEMMITGVNILKTTDTPGGQKLKDYRTSRASQGKTWAGQFEGVYPLNSFTADTDYEIISGATLSSGGIASMIKTGADVIKAYADTNK